MFCGVEVLEAESELPRRPMALIKVTACGEH